MKIYDCFQFFDEEMLLDLRLNIMDKYVDKFVITEASYMHNGKSKELLFDINKFSKFKDKIIYIVVDKQPSDIETIYEYDKDSKDTSGQKLVNNSSKREHLQRDMAIKYLAGNRLTGLSTDTKPTTVATNSVFTETDTKKDYIFNGSAWVAAGVGATIEGTDIRKSGRLITLDYKDELIGEHKLYSSENIKKQNIISRLLSSLNFLLWGDA